MQSNIHENRGQGRSVSTMARRKASRNYVTRFLCSPCGYQAHFISTESSPHRLRLWHNQYPEKRALPRKTAFSLQIQSSRLESDTLIITQLGLRRFVIRQRLIRKYVTNSEERGIPGRQRDVFGQLETEGGANVEVLGDPSRRTVLD